MVANDVKLVGIFKKLSKYESALYESKLTKLPWGAREILLDNRNNNKLWKANHIMSHFTLLTNQVG